MTAQCSVETSSQLVAMTAGQAASLQMSILLSLAQTQLRIQYYSVYVCMQWLLSMMYDQRGVAIATCLEQQQHNAVQWKDQLAAGCYNGWRGRESTDIYSVISNTYTIVYAACVHTVCHLID
jgi:hypothetical protein